MCEEPLLQRLDISQPFILTTDASGFAIGGILTQGKIGKNKPIAYASRSLSDTEKKYNTYGAKFVKCTPLKTFCLRFP